MLSSLHAVHRGKVYCKICPCKHFSKSHAARDFALHLEKQHRDTAAKAKGKAIKGWFVASQVKWQVQIVKALFDDDMPMARLSSV